MSDETRRRLIAILHEDRALCAIAIPGGYMHPPDAPGPLCEAVADRLLARDPGLFGGGYDRLIALLQADAGDPTRQTMWRYGIRHALTLVRHHAGAGRLPVARPFLRPAITANVGRTSDSGLDPSSDTRQTAGHAAERRSGEGEGEPADPTAATRVAGTGG